MMSTVFTVKFACDNCNKEWSEEYHEKVRVWRTDGCKSFMSFGHYSPEIPSVIYASNTRTKPINGTTIECPNCKTEEDVKIVQRIPIEERLIID